MSNGIPATGWIRDLPDWRDVMVGSKKANDVQGQYDSFTSFRATTFPTSADLRRWCTPVEDQMNLGSCTSQAVAGGVELLQRRFFGNYIDASRLFLYKTTRSLMGWTGDRGAQIRQTMKALAMFGVPPEKFWPYDIAKYEDEPTAFVYSMAPVSLGLEINILGVEALNGLKTGKKKNRGKNFRKAMTPWTYRQVLNRIQAKTEENRVRLLSVPPANTSRTCPVCKTVSKSNRTGEHFRCVACDYRQDADTVGALNVLARTERLVGRVESPMLQKV